jgi:3-oxoacyl-[acyl-carrier protein] reductase
MAEETPSALVTGGSGDIGSAVARELGASGYHVAVQYHRNADAAREVVESIDRAGGRAFALGANLTDGSEARDLVEEVLKRAGRLDVLVNNAGTSRDGFLMMMAEADWDEVIDTNLKTLYTVTKPALRHMIARRSGRIVNISSLSGVSGLPGQVNYAASKGGVLAFTRALSRELAPFNVLVNAVAPGLIASRMVDEMPGNIKDALVDAIPLKRPGEPRDVARAVAFLVSENATYITGHTLFVTGGLY